MKSPLLLSNTETSSNIFSPPSITSYFAHVNWNTKHGNGLVNIIKDISFLAPNYDVTLPKDRWEAPLSTEQFGTIWL